MAVFLPLAEAAAPELEAAATKAAPELEQGLQQGLKPEMTKAEFTQAIPGIESQLSDALGKQVQGVMQQFSSNDKGIDQLFNTSPEGGTTVDNLANEISKKVFHPKIDECCSKNYLPNEFINTLKGLADQATAGFVNQCVGELKNILNQEKGTLQQLSEQFASFDSLKPLDFGLKSDLKPEQAPQQKPHQDLSPVLPSPEPPAEQLTSNHSNLPNPTDVLKRPLSPKPR